MNDVFKRVLLGFILIVFGCALGLYVIERANTRELACLLSPEIELGQDALENARKIIIARIESLEKNYRILHWKLETVPGALRLTARGKGDFEEIVPLVCKRGLLEFRLVWDDSSASEPAPDEYEELPMNKESLNLMNLHERNVNRRIVHVKKQPEFVCQRLKSVKYGTQGLNWQTVITIQFLDKDTEEFARVTRENIGKQLAIVMDGQVQTSAVIRDEIKDGRVQLVGIRLRLKARQLADFLRAGALPCDFLPGLPTRAPRNKPHGGNTAAGQASAKKNALPMK